MDYNTGVVVDFDILMADKENAARQIAEGSASLEKLLLFCFENNIKTVSCCSHDSYMYFEVNDENLDLHIKLKKYFQENYGIEIMRSLTQADDKIMYDVAGEDDSIFEKLYKGLTAVMENKQDYVSEPDIECAYALLNKVRDINIEMPNEETKLFYIQSSPDKRKPELEKYFFTENYHGNNLYIMSRTEIQDELYKAYSNDEEINEKRGFLSRMLKKVFEDKKSK